MTNREQEIYNGLLEIGPEIAVFFKDAIKISKMEIDSKPYLLSHLAREIESGLRDILVSREKEDSKICDSCLQQINKKIGHKESILKSLGIQTETEFAKKWHSIAKQFPAYAHRHGAWKDPREQLAFDEVWNQFINVLEHLVGNYFAISDRVDLLLNNEEPTKEVIGALQNILKEESRNVYFFNNLKNKKWLPFLEKEHFFSGELNPPPRESEDNAGYYSMPNWACLQYLNVISLENSDIDDKATSKLLLKIIHDIISYKDKDGSRIENYYTDYSVYKIICNLPVGHLNIDHLIFIESSLKSKWHGLIGHEFGILIDRIIKENNGELTTYFINILLSYKEIDTDSFDRIQSIFHSYEFKSILDDYKEKLISNFGMEIMEVSYNMVKKIFKDKLSDFDTYLIPAIEDHSQTSFPEKYECQLIYLIRDCLLKLNEKEVHPWLKILKDSDEDIFKRLVFNIIQNRYAEFNQLLWNWALNPIDEQSAKHELYELIKSQAKSFTPQQIDILVNWIDSKKNSIPEEIKDDKETVNQIIAYSKREWFSALEESENEKIKQIVFELNKIESTEIKHPGFNSWHSSMSGSISPLSSAEISIMSLDEIIKFNNEYQQKPREFMGPSKDGLIDQITNVIKTNPENFNRNCEKLVGADTHLQYAWLLGLAEARRVNNFSFDCSEIYFTLIAIVERPEFWDAYNKNDKHKKWLIFNMLLFIEDCLRDDAFNFDEKMQSVLKEILFLIAKSDNVAVNDFDDLPMTAINCVKGKLYSAMIEFSLRVARKEKKDADRWDKDVSDLFYSTLLSKKENKLFHFVVGRYLFNIQFLDEKFVENNFHLIFSINDEVNWLAAIDGYFFHNARPSSKHFELFCEKNHLEKAITTSFQKININSYKGLIKQICRGYILDFEHVKIEKGVFQQLIELRNEEVYSQIIFFFWDPDHLISEDYVPKIKALWNRLFLNSIELKNPETDKLILSGTTKWLNSIRAIDEESMKFVKSSIPYLNQRDRYLLIEILSKYVDKFPKEVGEILCEMFTNKVDYDITRGKIKNIVETLYARNIKDAADRICLMHAKSGFIFLRETYDANNKK
jgi:hypothetical protein